MSERTILAAAIGVEIIALCFALVVALGSGDWRIAAGVVVAVATFVPWVIIQVATWRKVYGGER